MGYTQNTTATSWENFEFLIGNTDNTGGDDLIWAETANLGGGGTTRVSVGTWNGGGFDIAPIQMHTFDTQGVDAPFDVEVMDIEGDGDVDILYNLRTGLDNLIYVARGQAGGDFDFSGARCRHPDADESNWSQYQMYTGDINGDGRDDIIWVWPGQTNRIYTAIGKS